MNSTTERLRAGLYCRISSDRTSDAQGVERQRKDCLALAARLGWQVVDTYIDNDISAYSGKRRPEYERLIGDLATGRIEGVVTWHLDRLNRSPLELERLITVLEQHHVQLHTVTAGMFDLTTPSGRAVARTLGAWARFESEHKSERIRAKKRESALLGKPNGGSNRPYGYAQDKITLIPAEAKIIREAMRRFLAGTPTAQLCRDFNRRGIPTTGPRPWYSSNLDMILQSARIAGWRQQPSTRHTRTPAAFLVRAQWPAIVSRRSVERARALMADETLRPGSSRRWLLSGIALCGLCDQPMAMVHPGGTHHRYACQRSGRPGIRCGRVSIDADLLDAHLLAEIDTAVNAGELSCVSLQAQQLDDPAESIHERMTHAPDSLSNEFRSLPISVARAPGLLLTGWKDLPLRQQRALVQDLASTIRVGPMRQPRKPLDVGRVSIVWATNSMDPAR